MEFPASFWYLYCYLWTYFTPCSSVSIVNFEQVIAGWDQKRKYSRFQKFFGCSIVSLFFTKVMLSSFIPLYVKKGVIVFQKVLLSLNHLFMIKIIQVFLFCFSHWENSRIPLFINGLHRLLLVLAYFCFRGVCFFGFFWVQCCKYSENNLVQKFFGISRTQFIRDRIW